MTEQFYDNVSHEWVDWEPLGDQSRQAFARGLGNQAIHKITAMGTCGDPTDPNFSSHRQDTLFPIWDDYDVGSGDINNPEVKEWDPSRAPIESVWGARSEVVTVGVTNQTASAAGIAEAGLLTYGAILRGQKVITSIESNDESPESTKVARDLALSLLRATESRFPLFNLAPNLTIMAHQAGVAFSELRRHRHGLVGIETNYSLPPLRTDLTPGIYLSGSSGSSRPAWMKTITDKVKDLVDDVAIDDSYRTKWDSSMIPEELLKKLNTAVQIQVVSDETAALGALAETGARIMQADLSGQSYGIYIAPAYTGKAAAKDSNRSRALVRAHLKRLKQDFPTSPVFVTDKPSELVLFAASEFVQQRQRLELAR